MRTTTILLLLIGLFAFLVRIYKLDTLMPFIGDTGWFYISARNAISDGTIPLIGIASSHTWLHQGPYWTYILIILLPFFHFNPTIPAYFVAICGVITMYVTYIVGKELFSKYTGLLASILYASSPLVVINSRIPYHTSLIPLFVSLWIFTLFKWWRGKSTYFPFVVFFLAILYNFELSTQILWFPTLFFIFVTYFLRKKIFFETIQTKNIVRSISAWIVVMFPILLFDILHGFSQTIGFGLWIIYKIATFYKFTPENNIWEFIAIQIQRLFFIPRMDIAQAFCIGTIAYILYACLKDFNLQKNNYIFLFIIFLFITAGLFITGKSEAYLPIFFPLLLIMFALAIVDIANNIRVSYFATFVIAILIALLNIQTLINNNYFIGTNPGYGPSLEERKQAAEKIVFLSGNKQYLLLGKGEGSEHQSYIANYEYLVWLIGKPPSFDNYDKVITVSDNNSKVFVKIHNK